jgi:hypothetical protein
MQDSFSPAGPAGGLAAAVALAAAIFSAFSSGPGGPLRILATALSATPTRTGGPPALVPFGGRTAAALATDRQDPELQRELDEGVAADMAWGERVGQRIILTLASADYPALVARNSRRPALAVLARQ